jgi:hypothetical protein
MYVKHPLRKCTEKVFGATILVIIPKQPYQISQLQYWAYTPFLVLFIQNLQPWGLYTIFLNKILRQTKKIGFMTIAAPACGKLSWVSHG